MTEEKYLTLFDEKTFDPPANYFDDYKGMGTAAKEQEMQIDGHAFWGHDFKFLTNPITGKKTNFNLQLKRLTDDQKEKWLSAYTPKNDAFRKSMPTGRELSETKKIKGQFLFYHLLSLLRLLRNLSIEEIFFIEVFNEECIHMGCKTSKKINYSR